MATAALREYFDLYVNAAQPWMKVNVVASVPLQDMTYVQTLLFMLDGNLNEKTLVSPETIEKAFVYSAIWAFGMCLNLAEDGTDQRKCSATGGGPSSKTSSSRRARRCSTTGSTSRR